MKVWCLFRSSGELVGIYYLENDADTACEFMAVTDPYDHYFTEQWNVKGYHA